MKIKILRRTKADYIVYFGNVFYSLIIFLLITAQISQVAGPVIMPDETGYWATGAYLAGYDWSGVMKMSPYYGYGYGLFLGIIMYIFHDPVVMFKAAVILNGIFMIAIFWVTYSILSMLKDEWDGRFRGFLSFVVTLYTFNIYYALNSEAEILQVFIFLLLCKFILQSCRTRKSFEIRMIFISLLAVYMVACHQRNIGIVLSLSICIFLALLFKKISILSFFTYVVLLGISIFFFLKFKEIVNENIFLVSGYTAEEAGKVSGALGIFTLKGLKSFFECFLGRFFYLGCVTFLLVYRGLAVIIRDFLIGFKKKKYKKDKLIIFEIFIGMTLFGEIAIGSLAFLGNERRIDGFLYGRYNEHIVIPILLLGFISFRKIKENLKVQLLCSTILLILGIYMNHVYLSYNTLETSTHSISAIIGMPIFQNVTENSIQNVYSLGVAQFCLLVSWLIYFFLSSIQWKMTIIGGMLTVLFWTSFGINALHRYFYDFTEYNEDLYSFAKKVQDAVDIDTQLYYLFDKEKEAVEPTSSTWLMYRIQFFLPQNRIDVIDIDEFTQQEYVLVYKSSHENEIVSKMDYEQLAEGERMILYCIEK